MKRKDLDPDFVTYVEEESKLSDFDNLSELDEKASRDIDSLSLYELRKGIAKTEELLEDNHIDENNLKKYNRLWMAFGLIVVLTIIREIINNPQLELPFFPYFPLFLLFLGPSIYLENKLKKIKVKKRKYENIRSTFKEHLAINEAKIRTDEFRALGLLHPKHEALERYYTQNIIQTKTIFNTGRFIIFFGIGIITVTTLSALVSTVLKDTIGFDLDISLNKIITGLAGGVLVDVVGAVFLVMYRKTMETANAFQEGLIRINKAYLSNVFASKIKDPKIQNETLSAMAVALTEGKDITPKKDAKINAEKEVP